MPTVSGTSCLLLPIPACSPLPVRGAGRAGSVSAPKRCRVIYTLGSSPRGKSDKHIISFDTNSVYKISLLRDRLACSHQDATSCDKMELLFYSWPQLLPVPVPRQGEGSPAELSLARKLTGKRAAVTSLRDARLA